MDFSSEIKRASFEIPKNSIGPISLLLMALNHRGIQIDRGFPGVLLEGRLLKRDPSEPLPTSPTTPSPQG